ncbi:MAG: hypothetical protein AB1630_12080 [bacterium]
MFKNLINLVKKDVWAKEDVWAKLLNVKERLDILEKQNLPQTQKYKEVLEGCKEKINDAEEVISSIFKNYNVFWEIVHRIDEDIMLFISEDELLSKAINVKTSFDLNIKEEKLRDEWLGKPGEKGKLLVCCPLNKVCYILQGFPAYVHANGFAFLL